MATLVPIGGWLQYNDGVPYTSPLHYVYRYKSGSDIETERLRGYTGIHPMPPDNNYAWYGGSSTGFFVSWGTDSTYISSALSELYRPGGYPDAPDWNVDVPPNAIGWRVDARGEISPDFLDESWCDDLGLMDVYEEWLGPNYEGEDRYWAWLDTHWTDATNIQFYYDNNTTYYYPGDPWTGTVGPVHASDVHIQTIYRNGDAGAIMPQTNPIVVLNTPGVNVVGTNFSPPMVKFQKFYVNVSQADAFTIADWGSVMAAGYVMQPDPTTVPPTSIGYYRGLGLARGLITPAKFQWIGAVQQPLPPAPRQLTAGQGPRTLHWERPNIF